MEEDTYQPISCSNYDIYEIAIMHGDTLELNWCDDQGMLHQEKVRPLNLKIKNGAEYLLAESASGEGMMIRLDKIVAAK